MDPVPVDRLGFGPLNPDTSHSPGAAAGPPGPFGFDPNASAAGDATADPHVDLLALLLTVSAILAGLTAASLLALGLGALGAAWGPGPGNQGGAADGDVVAGVAAVLFIGITITVGVFAGACATTATGLRRRKTWSRPAALVLALVLLVIVPFGTALGIYAFWVLLRQRARVMLGAELAG